MHKSLVAVLTSLTAVTLLSACGTRDDPQPGRVVAQIVYHAEYPSYKSLRHLESSADVVAEVRLTGVSRTILLQPVLPIDPTDPVENPRLGVVGPEPSAPPIVATVYAASITNSIRGAVHLNDEIEIKELGGIHAGVQYVAEDQPSPSAADSYLVFLSGDGSGPYSLLNPIEAKYPKNSVGRPVRLKQNAITATAEEIAKYSRR